MTQVLLRPAAVADIEDAVAWYELRRAGLGQEFLESVESSLNAIGAWPKAYPVVHRDTRRLIVRRFPYAIFYRAGNETLLVVACMHVSRDPLRWKSRT